MSDEKKKRYGTPISQFRLKPETLADLDRIAEFLRTEHGETDASRASAVRYAARIVAKKITKKNRESD